MSIIGFAHESGLDDDTKCYAIGAVVVPDAELTAFNESIDSRASAHGVTGRATWQGVSNNHRLINFTLECLHQVLSSKTTRFSAIVVNTQVYRKWSEPSADRTVAFSITYTYLLKYLATVLSGPIEMFVEDRPDSYDKEHEVLEIVGNRMLAQLPTAGHLDAVKKVCSREHRGLQLADLFTGALCDAHRLRLDPEAHIDGGKRLAISRMAQLLGLDALHYDTWPNSHFNIWHFPKEFRAQPATVDIRCADIIPLVTAVDLRDA